MADPFANLLGYSNEYAQQQMGSNPWAIAAGQGNALAKSNLINDPYKNLLLQSMGGLAQGFASVPMQRDYSAAQNEALGQLSGVAGYSGMGDPFAGVSQSLMPFARQVLAERAAEIRKQNLDTQKMLLENQMQRELQFEGEALKNPLLAGSEQVRAIYAQKYGAQPAAGGSVGMIEPNQPTVGLEESPEQRLIELNRRLPADQAKIVFQQEQERQGKQREEISKYILEEGSKLQSSKQFINELDSAITRAGETGGVIAPLFEDTFRELKLRGQAKVSEGDEALKAQTRLEGRQALAAMGMEAIGRVKQAFPGQVSNFEMQQYAKVAPGINKLPEENKEILNRAKRMLAAAEAQHGWIQNEINSGKSIAEAQAAFMRFEKQNPTFITMPNGQLEINPVWENGVKASVSAVSMPTQAPIVTAPDGKRIKIIGR